RHTVRPRTRAREASNARLSRERRRAHAVEPRTRVVESVCEPCSIGVQLYALHLARGGHVAEVRALPQTVHRPYLTTDIVEVHHHAAREVTLVRAARRVPEQRIGSRERGR